MIDIDLDRRINDEISGLMAAYRKLPKNIANKHMRAAVGRSIKPHKGTLKKNTPPGGVRRGRRRKGEKPRSSGALRKAVAVKTKSRRLVTSGVLGYRGGPESRKAIWLEFGTSRGLAPRRMMEQTLNEIRPQVQAVLPKELRFALTKAVKDVAPPGTSRYRGG